MDKEGWVCKIMVVMALVLACTRVGEREEVRCRDLAFNARWCSGQVDFWCT